MIEREYGKVVLSHELSEVLTLMMAHFDIPENAKRIALNCRHQHYYQHREGLHPIEIQLDKQASQHWTIVCMASFSYPTEEHQELDVELYFHLKNGWCYQPDAGGELSMAQPTILSVFQSWTHALYKHLTSKAFDDIALTLVH
ncbi:DUF2787 domain-containing protein [Vibrio sp. 03-59-1]|uniref:DUF2787 family protein n=1 Tax=Vibrio sp. 03-59-1 TaxID=2607607 RepID=UPI001493A24A|nr:DUF2787 family protein [Vibrio sp. 03-59-1]NOH84672.1 DUF2787 domain-containing protein [Vibrio sp. 03-59-1]